MGNALMLRDVLQFLCHDGDDKESADNVQICFKNDEWDDFEEVNAASEMLKPFLDCEVTCMDADKSILLKDECCIRVSIDETTVHRQVCGVSHD